MQVTSLLSREDEHEHDESCESCGHEHSHAVLPLKQTLLGLIFVLNSFVVDWIVGENAKAISSFSAMLGAIILGFPIMVTAIKDLKRGLLTTNELVALAVMASFGSGHYQEAGVVAFFM